MTIQLRLLPGLLARAILGRRSNPPETFSLRRPEGELMTRVGTQLFAQAAPQQSQRSHFHHSKSHLNLAPFFTRQMTENPMPMRSSTLILVTALITSLAISPLALSHGGATGIVKERMELMEGIGKQMKRMGAMAKGKKPFDPDAFAEGAELVIEGAPKMPGLFPEGSLQHPTEALPRIWEDWKRFEESTQQLGIEAAKLREVAADGDKRAVISQFARMGKVCSSCHKSFRKKKSKN